MMKTSMPARCHPHLLMILLYIWFVMTANVSFAAAAWLPAKTSRVSASSAQTPEVFQAISVQHSIWTWQIPHAYPAVSVSPPVRQAPSMRRTIPRRYLMPSMIRRNLSSFRPHRAYVPALARNSACLWAPMLKARWQQPSEDLALTRYLIQTLQPT